MPDGRSFRITVNGERRHLFASAPAHIQGVTLRLWLNAVVRAGDRVEVSLRENAAGDDPESGVLLKGSRRW